MVDLGVGLWAHPLPMDFDGDGDNDLLVSCPDKPFNGTYFFENTSGNVKLPVFEPGVRIGPGFHSVRVSYVGSRVDVMTAAKVYEDFPKTATTNTKTFCPEQARGSKKNPSQHSGIGSTGTKTVTTT